MTDNEKRAHDLALLATKAVMKIQQNNVQYGKDEMGNLLTDEPKLDIYAKYKEAYDSCLEAINHDYPDGVK